MKSLLPLSLIVLLIAVSCSGNGEKKIISVEKKIVTPQPVAVAVNREMTVDIKGMSCEHSCGGSIRMALKETGAVDRCSFDFKDNRAVNTAFITFDKDKISADKILTIIEKLNEGQFTTAHAKTRTVVAKKIQESSSTVETNSETNEPEIKKIDVSASSFEIPNLLDLFSRLLR